MLTGTKERWRFLLVTNLLLLLLGLTLTLLSISMLVRFLESHLPTVSALFSAAPAVGLIAGIFAVASASRGLFLWRRKREVTQGFRFLAAFLAVSAAFCLAACVMAFRLREDVVFVFSAAKVDLGMLGLYGRDRQVTERWDELHRTFGCCGASVNGYLDWTDKEDGVLKEVPDSCCVEESSGCGKSLLFSRLDVSSVAQRINVKGCMVAVKESLSQEVVGMLHSCAFVALFAGFVEILLVFSVCCFAQHVRRFKNLDRLFMEAMNKDADKDSRSISIIVEEISAEENSIRSSEDRKDSHVLDVTAETELHRSCGSSVECISTAAAADSSSKEGQVEEEEVQNQVGNNNHETGIVFALDLASTKTESIREEDEVDDDDIEGSFKRNGSVRGQRNLAFEEC